MIITKKIGRLSDVDVAGRFIEWIQLEWFETGKRILHKKTSSGRQVMMKFLSESQQLTQDDVIYEDSGCIIVIDILPCEAMVITPQSLFDAACFAYEIGNKHLPLFFEEGKLLVPYDPPSFRMLAASGFTITRETKKLIHPIRTSVAAHAHNGSGVSLFSKILQLTNPQPDG